MNYQHKQKNTHGGYVILMSVLVLGAIGVVITTSLIMSGLASSRTSFVIEQSSQARALADMCAEEALQQIRDVTEFVGNGDLSTDKGTCVYLVTNQGEENRTIEATGFVDSVTRRVKIIIAQINPAINITSWQEVADF